MNLRHDDASVGAAPTSTSDAKLPPQVLVVDDLDEVRLSISFFLRTSGYRVLEAEDGLAAQVILLAERPALVICDLEMPVCDGWEFLEYCHARHPALPVLIASGAPLGRQPEIERWAAGFLPKPFTLARFRTEVRRLVFLAA